MSTEYRQFPQWERIKLDYRAGIKGLRQIAAEQNISQGGDPQGAERDDWSWVLSERIQDKAEQSVRKEAVRSEVCAERRASERPTALVRSPRRPRNTAGLRAIIRTLRRPRNDRF
ncbi:MULTISPECIES: hypothetical protein [Delftia]|uniref:hypothetical protein n=1 Tax=Delftia TaxID=80865 RepID=UPI00092A89C8|nr:MULTISPECIES: hypothetical protein [Delftia]MDH0420009.1 hypothetical protein [Delftia tsuruhatensis]OJX17285.1 MAG: hypothetical protein BGO79_04490 [Delftia sp. 67-8]QFS65647.1 hypothetical protein GCS91_15640 [Delftia tsuruhatensis]WON87217.1 hypothetical protein OK021_21055 [Delftia sp. UGAL515B_04]